MTTQCDLREPVSLPKPAPPPEVRREVVIKKVRVCNTCNNNIEDCDCEEVCPQCEHDIHDGGVCALCHPSPAPICPQCQPHGGYPTCQNSHQHGTGCHTCDHTRPEQIDCHMCDHGNGHGTMRSNEGNHGHGHQHGHHMLPPHHEHGNHNHHDYSRRRSKSRSRKPRYYGNGHYTDTDYTQRSGYSTGVSDVESCSSKIYLVSQSQRKLNASRAIEPPPTIARGTTTLRLHSIDSLDEGSTRAGRVRKKQKRKRRSSRQEFQATTASDAESALSKKSYVYLPLDCPEKMRGDTQAYLNRLYNVSKSSTHGDHDD